MLVQTCRDISFLNLALSPPSKKPRCNIETAWIQIGTVARRLIRIQAI